MSASANWFQRLPPRGVSILGDEEVEFVGAERDRVDHADVRLDLLVEERPLLGAAFIVSANAASAPARGSISVP